MGYYVTYNSDIDKFGFVNWVLLLCFEGERLLVGRDTKGCTGEEKVGLFKKVQVQFGEVWVIDWIETIFWVEIKSVV